MWLRVSEERAMISRPSFRPPISPVPLSCMMRFPATVVSTGPATTGTSVASAVHWQREEFCVPPPTMLAHYLDLLTSAGMVCGLPKFSGEAARSQASSPKLQVLNNALMTALSGYTYEAARADREYWGRLVESAVGAYLANAAAAGLCELYYWRDGNREVDFVLRFQRELAAIEVKSSRLTRSLPSMEAFASAFKPKRCFLIGGDGIPIDAFLTTPLESWLNS